MTLSDNANQVASRTPRLLHSDVNPGLHHPDVNPGLHHPDVNPRLVHPDVDPRDVPALRDLVRFGIMADDQFARRYADPPLGFTRLPELKQAGLVEQCWETLEGANIYEPTRLARLVVSAPARRLRRVYRGHISHDVAVVDLADHLLSVDSSAQWVTEGELQEFLNSIATAPRRMRGDTRHRPDGLLVVDNHCIGVELEHSDKYWTRYEQISGWFVREWRVDRVRWFVDNPRIVDRLRQVNAQHGFDRDMEIAIEPFPTGVRLRLPPGRYRP